MNPLFQAMNTKNASTNNSDFMAQAMQAYRNGTINQFGEKQFNENPEFRKFIESMRGKDPFQIAKQSGFDLSKFMK